MSSKGSVWAKNTLEGQGESVHDDSKTINRVRSRDMDIDNAQEKKLDKGKGKGSFYVAQYPVRWTAQRSLHFLTSLADLFNPTPTRFLWEAF